MCHSAHLCSSASCCKLPGNVEQFARDIFSLLKHSTKRQDQLEECKIFVNEKPHKMLYPRQTRWLSIRVSTCFKFWKYVLCMLFLCNYKYFKFICFQLVVNRILMHWTSLTLFFQNAVFEDNLPIAKIILNALINNIYKGDFNFLSYVLESVTKINLEY